MTVGLLGKKIGMTQIFDNDGKLIPVTLIEAGPCYVLQIKSKETDGYSAVQLGFDKKNKRKANRPELGHFQKAGVEPMRFIREMRVDDSELKQLTVGQALGVEQFKEGERVDITGISKGHGFTGTVKRFGVSRGPMSHGSRYHRRPGSTGASSDPSRIWKGKVMPGHKGNRRCTMMNLKVVKTDKERNIIMIKGSVPGSIHSYLIIRKSIKSKHR
ncbi:50S ribosomal protein L3 [Candidatus Sumerlaeota bacterium]|nr:50S ribosomal protein L3 [Candidatus Sumerlaeota bacterium]